MSQYFSSLRLEHLLPYTVKLLENSEDIFGFKLFSPIFLSFQSSDIYFWLDSRHGLLKRICQSEGCYLWRWSFYFLLQLLGFFLENEIKVICYIVFFVRLDHIDLRQITSQTVTDCWEVLCYTVCWTVSKWYKENGIAPSKYN